MKKLLTYEQVRNQRVSIGRDLAQIKFPVSREAVEQFEPLGWSVQKLLRIANDYERGTVGRADRIKLLRNIARQKQQWLDAHPNQSEVA